MFADIDPIELISHAVVGTLFLDLFALLSDFAAQVAYSRTRNSRCFVLVLEPLLVLEYLFNVFFDLAFFQDIDISGLLDVFDAERGEPKGLRLADLSLRTP